MSDNVGAKFTRFLETCSLCSGRKREAKRRGRTRAQRQMGLFGTEKRRMICFFLPGSLSFSLFSPSLSLSFSLSFFSLPHSQFRWIRLREGERVRSSQWHRSLSFPCFSPSIPKTLALDLVLIFSSIPLESLEWRPVSGGLSFCLDSRLSTHVAGSTTTSPGGAVASDGFGMRILLLHQGSFLKGSDTIERRGRLSDCL